MTEADQKKKIKSKDAARLKKLREALGFSASRLAEEFKVTHGAISKWEKGENPVPGPILKLIELYEQQLVKQKSAK